MFKRKNESTLAIDLAPDAVRLMDVTVRRGEVRVGAVISGALETGTPETLPERHLAVLESLVTTHRIKTHRCIATLPTSLVVTRSVSIDPTKTTAVEDQIRLTLQNTGAGQKQDLLFDYWPVLASAGQDRPHEVLVVAAEGNVVHRYLKGLEKIKLNCVHLEVSPCALAALIAKLIPSQEQMAGAVVLTESLGYFAMVEKQRVLFWRPFELAAASRGPNANLERVGDEISKCVSHMVGSLHMDGMTEVFAFGPNAADERLSSYLMNRFNLNVRTPSPFDGLGASAVPEEIKAAMDAGAITNYAAAAGLALQAAEGAYDG